MSFSSGTYTLYATGNPVVTNTTISSTWANNTLNDIATALSTCLLKDGTQTATASIGFAQGIDVTTAATTPSTTFACFNTNATTVNAFGAASVALNIGHASAAAAFAGGISIPTGKTLSGAGAINISGNITGAAISGTTGTFSGKISANAGVSNAAAIEIYPQASTTAHIIQTGSATNGWKWIQDESTTGDLYWQRRVASADTTVVTFHRSTGNVTFAAGMTISGLAGVGNRYAYIDTNGLLTAGAAYP